MAIRIPTPESEGLGQVARASGQTGFINATAPVITGNAENLMRLAQYAGQLGAELVRRNDQTSMLEAGAEWNLKRQEWLDPQSGIFSRRAGDAKGTADWIKGESERFAADLKNKYGNLSNDGKAALEQMLMGEQQRLYERAAAHEYNESFAYENQMLEAGIILERNRAAGAVGTPGGQTEIAASLLNAGAQIDSWLENQGINPEGDYGKLLKQSKMTDHVLAVAEAQAALDPEGADDFVRASLGKIDEGQAGQWLAQNRKRVVTLKAKKAVSVAQTIDEGATVGVSNHSTNISLEMGPDRPHAPNEAILNVVGTAVQDVLGPGATVRVFSGKDDGDNDSNNSLRHLSGNAVDVHFYRQDGSQVKLTDPEFRAIAKAAANRGALGVGFGIEYMGHGMHLDLVDPDPALGQGHAWGSGGDAMETELIRTMEASEGLITAQTGAEYILSISDPDVRAAAIDHYETVSNFTYQQYDQRSKTAANEIISGAFEMAKAGERIDVDELMAPYLNVLGSRQDSVRNQLLALANGDTIQNNNSLSDSLSRMATSPDPSVRAEFADIDLRTTYGDKLDNSHIDALTAMQNSIRRDSEGIPSEGGIVFYGHDEVIDIIQPILNRFDPDERADKSTLIYNYLEGYQQAVYAAEKRRPTRREMELEARRYETAKVPQFNPTGRQWTSGKNKSIERMVEQADAGSLDDLLQVDDLVLEYNMGGGQVAKHRVSPTEISSAITAWRQVYGVDPLPSQVIMLLQQYPPSAEDFNLVE